MMDTKKTSLKLCRTRNISEDDDEWKRLKNKLGLLESNGKIDVTEIETFWNERLLEHQHEDDPRIDEWMEWASRKHLELPIKEEVHRGSTHLILPDIFLQVKVGRKLKGFFPCSDGEYEYTVEHFLKSLKENEDWENWDKNISGSPVRDSSPIHGAIKSNLLKKVSTRLGEEWESSEKEEEKYVGENEWRADLIFKHESETRYNLVEVKPSKGPEEIDKAFGQLFRYRHSFVNDKINVSLDDIELTIAAPDFYDSHKEAAEELGINLVYTPYAEPV